MRSFTLVFTVVGAFSAAAAPTGSGEPGWQGGQNDYGPIGEPASVAQQRAAAVKEAFEFAWDGYYK